MRSGLSEAVRPGVCLVEMAPSVSSTSTQRSAPGTEARLIVAQPPHSSLLSPHSKGTVLGFDFGLARIGVAVGELETRQAQALRVIQGEAGAQRFGAIAELLQEWRPVALVVGLPVSLQGEETAMTARCRRFANQLNGRFGLPVSLVDERLSSVEADEMLRELKLDWRARREHVDALAAQRILQSYLDSDRPS